MSSCPRCLTVTEPGTAYCGACGKPRITEDLRTPTVRPDWQNAAWEALILLFSIWLVVTAAVAYLREARAVRVAREQLTQGKNQEAWSLLAPFLEREPNHLQALFLCGKATVRLDLRAEMQRCLDQLRVASPDLAKDLETEARQVLSDKARALGCAPAPFLDLLAWAGQIEPSIATRMIANLDGIVEACRSAGADDQVNLIAASFSESGQVQSLMEKGYDPAIRKALAQARYGDAEVLAQKAIRLFPNTAAGVAAILEPERRKVTSTLTTLRELSSKLKTDPQIYGDFSWCFPLAAPQEIRTARDGWGREIIYHPRGEADGQGCYTGFTIMSLGSDGQKTPTLEPTPIQDIICWFSISQGEACQEPSRFWRITAEEMEGSKPPLEDQAEFSEPIDTEPMSTEPMGTEPMGTEPS